jgi:hypothetical protein
MVDDVLSLDGQLHLARSVLLFGESDTQIYPVINHFSITFLAFTRKLFSSLINDSNDVFKFFRNDVDVL